ncbi:MAG TPA: hypothetical protein PK411_11420 [Mesotoga infera]|nr:hypothetical protein [Mesotoga infera]HRV03048.1 hypothetical protein [Mesotoga sp.]
MNEPFEIKGKITIEISGPRGKRVIKKDNLIVDVGKNVVRDLLANGTGNGISRMALGTGTTAASSSDTGLETQSYIKNISTKEKSNKKITARTFFASGEVSGTFSEIGMFCSTTLFSRVVLGTAIVKAPDESLLLTWEITF